MNVLAALVEKVKGGETCILATVIKAEGSAPRKDSARVLIGRDGARFGTVGGGEVEAQTLAEAGGLFASPESTRLVEFPSHCGGNVTLFLEKFSPPKRLIVVGAGNVGRAVALLALRSGYSPIVVAPGAAERLADVREIEVAEATDPVWLDGWSEPANSHLIVATGNADADVSWAVAGLERGFSGVGVVGSANKAAAIRHAAAGAGLPPKKARSVRCPVGIDIGGVTPEEIAVSIIAELIRLDRTGGVPEAWRRASRG
jgi:xanthine dehydrogenase accessory factor